METKATTSRRSKNAEVVLRLDDVHKHFAGVTALKGVSAEFRRGKVLGIVGPNGAGKTTMIDVGTGRHTPDKGHVILNGRSINGRPLESIGRLGLVRTFQEGAVPSELTVIDYMTLGRDSGPFSGVLANILWVPAALRHQQQARSSAMEFLSRYDFADRADRLCHQLSGGEQKFLTLLRAFWTHPEVLLLDEPTTALNATLKTALVDMMKHFVAGGGAIGVISHEHDFITSVADDILHLRMGEAKLFSILEFKDWIDAEHDSHQWRHQRLTDAQNTPDLRGDSRFFSVRDLQVGMNGKRLVHNISFDVDPAEVLGVVGPNGAGKSMLLKSILGIVPRSRGQVFLNGTRLDTLPPHRVARAGLGLVLQGARVPPRLTVADAIQMAWARGKKHVSSSSPPVEDVDELLHRLPVLASRSNVNAGFLSGGEQQLLSIAMALAQRPAVLMLDEPSVGLQDQVLHDLFGWLADLSRKGLPLIVVEQDVEALLTIATTGATMLAGTLGDMWQPGSAPPDYKRSHAKLPRVERHP